MLLFKKNAHFNLPFLILIFFTILSNNSHAQADTLHLDYPGIQIKLPDSLDIKLNEWAKKITLNTQKYDVDVIAYYQESDFKKYAEERSSDMFLILNRKAREAISINVISTKRGKKFQRSRVDIIYKLKSNVSESKPQKTEKKK